MCIYLLFFRIFYHIGLYRVGNNDFLENEKLGQREQHGTDKCPSPPALEFLEISIGVVSII